jgi:hypothetical protein
MADTIIRSRGADEPIAEILALILRHVDADAVLTTNIGWPRPAAKKRLGDTTLASIRVALSRCCLLSMSVHFQPKDRGLASVYAPPGGLAWAIAGSCCFAFHSL